MNQFHAPTFHWQSLFVGREKELECLQYEWRKAKDGEARFVVLLGESGLGKTRLVQQFYSWLSQHEDGIDPEGYWPDLLERQRNSLTINPQFSGRCSQDPIPWLWWGIRFTNPEHRNLADTSGCGLVDALPLLEPHLLALQKRKETIARSRDLCINLITAMGGLLGFAALGPATAAVVSGIGVYSALTDSKSVLEKSMHLVRNAREQKGVGELQSKQRENSVSRIQAYFEGLLQKNNKGQGAIPVILLIDDAQWADIDTLKFLEQLYRKSADKNWPLLVLCTHWEREWYQDHETLTGASRSEEPRTLAELIHRTPRLFDGNWQPMLIPKVCGGKVASNNVKEGGDNSLQPVLYRALPGLTSEQQRQILEIVDGNPGFLVDLVTYLSSDLQYLFEGEDPSSPLSEEGADELNNLLSDLDHFQLNRKRFYSINPHLRQLLAWSSHQGMQFVEQLTLEIAENLDQGEKNDSVLLGSAKQPLVLIEAVSELSSEFRQRSIHELARQELHRLPSRFARFRTELRDTLWKNFEADGFGKLSASEREQLLKLLADNLAADLENSVVEKDEANESQVKLGRTLAKLFEQYDENSQSRQMVEIAQIIVQQQPNGGWREEEITYDLRWKIAEILREFSHHADSITLWNDLISEKQRQRSEGCDDWQPEMQDRLVTAYINRGICHKNRENLGLAMIDYDAAIELEISLQWQLDEKWMPTMQNNLARAYQNRGAVHRSQHHLGRAMMDYESAVTLRESLWITLGGKLQPTIQDDLADSYLDRGNGHLKQGLSGKAADDYGSAIKIREALRTRMDGAWPHVMQNHLAMAYQNHGVALTELNRLEESIEDYDAAISIRNGLRQDLGDDWPPVMQDTLANTIMNRGISYGHLMKSEEAITAHTIAIEYRVSLREELEPSNAWPPLMKNRLAMTYVYRGSAYRDQGKLKEAISDYDKSIELRESLRHDLKDEWLPHMRNQLANAYFKRGEAYSDLGYLEEALLDAEESVVLHQDLRNSLESTGGWTSKVQNYLVIAIIGRGNVYSKQNKLQEALLDYDKAIDLGKRLQLRTDSSGSWSPFMKKVLVSAYLNRGMVYQKQYYADWALSDYFEAIDLATSLLFQDNYFRGFLLLTRSHHNRLVILNNGCSAGQHLKECLSEEAIGFIMRCRKELPLEVFPHYWLAEFEKLQILLGNNS